MGDNKKWIMVLIVLAAIAGLVAPALAQTTTGQSTILQNLAGNKDFSTLAGAAKTAGLDTTLSGAGPYTVFAPTNAAFGKIPSDSLNALTRDQAKTADLLKYHVVPGRLSYNDLAGVSSVTAIDGRTLPVARQADGSITVGGARVTPQGIGSSNGVIYPVDTVMMPPGFAMPAAAQAPAPGLPWWLIPLALLGLAALALYLLTRPRRHEEPRGLKAEPVREERARTEETRRPEETMRQVRESTAAYREPQITDIVKNMALPLSGVALSGLNALISKGTFSDKQDFIGYLARTYFANNMGSSMETGKAPEESMIMDVIDKTGIAKGFSGDDTRNMLVPLLMTGFTAVYNYLNKRPAVEITR